MIHQEETAVPKDEFEQPPASGSESKEPVPERRQRIDLRGTNKKVSIYALVRVVDALKNLKPGEESVELLVDSFAGLRNDIQAWSRLSGHSVEQITSEPTVDHFIITKGVQKEQKEHLAIVISNDGLGELLSPLGFALAAATGGMDVSIYFQGPGVRVLKKGFLGNLSGMSRPFSFLARRGMAAMGHELPVEKLKQLHNLEAKFYVCHPSMEVFGVKESQLMFDNVILAEYATFLNAIRGSTIMYT